MTPFLITKLRQPNGFTLVRHRAGQGLPPHFLLEIAGQGGFRLPQGFQHRLFESQISFLLLRVGQVDAGLDAAEIDQRLQEVAGNAVGEGGRFKQVFEVGVTEAQESRQRQFREPLGDRGALQGGGGREPALGDAEIGAMADRGRRRGQELPARRRRHGAGLIQVGRQRTGLPPHQHFQLPKRGDEPGLEGGNLGGRGLGLGPRPHHIVPRAAAYLEQPFRQSQRVLLRVQVRARDAQLVLKAPVFDIDARQIGRQRHERLGIFLRRRARVRRSPPPPGAASGRTDRLPIGRRNPARTG